MENTTLTILNPDEVAVFSRALDATSASIIRSLHAGNLSRVTLTAEEESAVNEGARVLQAAKLRAQAQVRRYDQISDDGRTFTDPEAFEEPERCPDCGWLMIPEEHADDADVTVYYCPNCES